MTPKDALIEKMARAIANANGDDYESVPMHKAEWVSGRGEFGGRFRDVNEPYQVDYLEMARAAYEAEHEADSA